MIVSVVDLVQVAVAVAGKFNIFDLSKIFFYFNFITLKKSHSIYWLVHPIVAHHQEVLDLDQVHHHLHHLVRHHRLHRAVMVGGVLNVNLKLVHEPKVH